MGKKFCHACGVPLNANSSLSPPESHTSKELPEKILTSRSALDGERKQVTVLFADMRGSMELLAERDPEEARKILDPSLNLMMESVHRYEGTVNQVLGDGIMALFGAPIAHEDHALRACYAALRIQDSARRYCQRVLRTHGVPVQVRIGLNSGEVVVRSIGSDLQMDYTAVGQTTHLAARMEQIATPDSILITSDTLKLAEGYVQVKPLGHVPIKGLRRLVEVYELTGAASLQTRLQALAARRLSRFVGRDAEMNQLHRALAQVTRGSGQIVAVVGEPGVGKSRLYYEFIRPPNVTDCLVLETGAVSYGKSTPYLPIVELLKTYFGIDGRDETGGSATQKMKARLLALDPELGPTLPAFLALLDQSIADDTWQALDSVQRRERILDALRRLFLRESLDRPVCLIFENLHWIDSESQALLDMLAGSIALYRVLLLVNYRPGYQHGWVSKTGYTQFSIGPLPPERGAELLEDLLGADPLLSNVKRHLIEITDGNPFFLEESLRTLIESGALIGERGAYQLATPVVSIRVPATVQAVLAARIDRLSARQKELLQAAAVIGKHVPFGLLEALAGLSADNLRRGLSDLVAAEFLYETRLFPDLEYTFKHALTHEVAYESLVQERRRELHARVAATIESLYPKRLEEHIEQLAEHHFRAELWEKAITYLRRAGQKAFARSAYRAATTRFEQALVALERLPRTREVVEQLIDTRLEIRNALLPVGEPDRVLDQLRAAGALALSLGDRQRAGWVTAYTSACFWSTGNYAAALDAARAAGALALEVEDGALRVYADIGLTWIAHSVGDYAEGVRTGTRVVEALQGNHFMKRLPIPSLPAVLARTWLVSCLVELGNFTQAKPLAEESVGLAEQLGEPWSLVDAYLGFGVLKLRYDDLDGAKEVLERGIEICRRFSVDVWFPPLASSLGHTYALTGRLTEASTLLRHAIAQATAAGVRFYHSLSLIWLGETYLLDGRLNEAVDTARAALELCDRYSESGNRAYTLRLLAQVAAARPSADPMQAETDYRYALEVATNLGMRPLMTQCRLGLADLLRRTQRLSQAEEELSLALALSHDMGMVRTAARAKAELESLR